MTPGMTRNGAAEPMLEMLLLSAPAQHAANNEAVMRDPRGLRQWIADLAVSDVQDTVQRLHGALEPFNELQLRAAERLRLLEIYRDAFEDILYLYDELRLRTLPIANAQRQSLAQEIMWLYLALANGYKILVRDAYEAGTNPIRDNGVLLAAFRAMELIIHALIYAYRARQDMPPLACLELHQLYRFAEHYGVLDCRIRPIRHAVQCPTIECLYQQFMLLALSDPYGFDGPELFGLYAALEQFAGLGRIPRPANDGGDVGYRIGLTEDTLPAPVMAGFACDDMTRVLDVRPVTAAIARWLSDSSGLVGNERQLLQRLSLQLAAGGCQR